MYYFKDDKIKYHGAAAIASNLVVGLIGLSEELLKQCGFDEKSAHNALAPIIKGNVKHIVEEGVVEALTGPIERCDVSTVRKHMSVFDKKANEIYKAVSKEVLEIAKIKTKIEIIVRWRKYYNEKYGKYIVKTEAGRKEDFNAYLL